MELRPDIAAGGVEGRRRRLLQTSRPLVGMLGLERTHLFARAPLRPSLGFALLDQIGDALPVLLLGEMLPARQGLKLDDLLLGIGEPLEGLPALPGGVLLGTIEPVTFRGLAF